MLWFYACVPVVFDLSPIVRSGCFGPHSSEPYTCLSHSGPRSSTLVCLLLVSHAFPLVCHFCPTVCVSYSSPSMLCVRMIPDSFPTCLRLVSTCLPHISQYAVGMLGHMDVHLPPSHLPAVGRMILYSISCPLFVSHMFPSVGCGHLGPRAFELVIAYLGALERVILALVAACLALVFG